MRDKQLRQYLGVEFDDGEIVHGVCNSKGLASWILERITDIQENISLILNHLNLEIKELSGKQIVKKELHFGNTWSEDAELINKINKAFQKDKKKKETPKND